ncbi:MAG: transglutaminase domain-containing protein [Clostridia bacterium]|nr:transglutaminase domain-containing protein [Clostridia bacterium]
MNDMKLPVTDLSYLSVGLPEDVKMYHFSGNFAGEIAAIDRRLNRPVPLCLRKRLEIQRIFAAQLMDDYPLTRADVVKGMQTRYPAADDSTLDALIASGNVDYILKNGEMRFQHQAISNIFKTHTHDLEKIQNSDYVKPDTATVVPENIRIMKEKGGRAFRYEVEYWMKLEPHAEKPGETLKIWFPYPVACDTQPAEEIKLVSSSHPVTVTGTVHRTAYMEVPCEAGATYSVRYSFVNRAKYTAVDLNRAEYPPVGEGLTTDELANYTGEQYPHIRFTPFIRMLAAEIAGDETDPLRLARRVYDYICEHIRYSYVRDYLLIENIPEFVLMNGYGDCGTMALAFITLCRALGIPAKWQSGSSCSPDGIGSHDWAMFNVAPYGWLYCDPSYGEGAARAGNEVRRNHYFGNLDPFRLVASNEFQQPLTPDKAFCRMDPYDNQSGEAEYETANIFFDDRTHGRRVVAWEEIEM